MPEGPYTVYRYERRRGRRWPYFVVAAICVFGAVLAWQLLGVPRVSAVTPGPDAYVKHSSPVIVLNVHGLAKLGNVKVTLDGDDVTASATRDHDKLRLATTQLADGTHTVSFSATSSNLLRHRLQRAWTFTVDTSVPTLELKGSADEGRINTSPATFSGSTEAFAMVTVTSGTVQARGQADVHGNYSVSAQLPDGASHVTIATVDRAGNSATKQLNVYVDAEPPVLKTTHIPKTWRHSGLTFHINARDQLVTPKVKLVLDDQVRHFSGPASKGVLAVKNLAQGRHTLSVTASDQGGNVVSSKQTFVVDSTQHFGSASLWPGAHGNDVRELQKRLATVGVFSGSRSSTYDSRTEAAVRAFESKYGLTVDGRVGGSVLNALSGQIVVDLSQLRLYLYRDGKLVKSYTVAAGQPAFPTPTGTYAIVNMQMNPTWLPPNSDWAKEAKPIPPGTENPLGTRWMGTSAPGVGIHGVPPSEDGSIGSYASHGCVRMHNWDAIDLFARVTVGMPVIIRS